MATLTKEQYEALKRQGRGNYRGQTSSSGQFIIEADKFVGDLQGNADTATRLRDPITISLGGDAEGSAQFAGSSFRLDATIREAEHSVNSDVAENAKHSAQASHADLANIATLALRSMLANNATHADRASNADNADHSDEATHADSASSASRATYDSNGDNIHNTFVNKQQQITNNTNLLSNHTTTIADHERRITNNENQIEDLDTRVSDIETSTDVGRITQRIVNIEAKNTEQDGRLDAINDTMVTLSTAQYILSPKTFNAGSKTIMDNEAGATEITNKEYVDNKVLSSTNYVTNYTDNKVLSASRYMTDYVDNKVLSTAQYIDDNFMSLTKSQYVTGLNTFEQLPQSSAIPSDEKDLGNKAYIDTLLDNTLEALKKIIHIPSYQRENDFVVSDKLKITISSNLSIKVNNKYYHNDASVLLDISNADNWDSTEAVDYTVNTNRAGKDFYIYAVEHEDNFCKLILSANSTVPTGYTADTSRKIGGFHCLCNSVEAGKVWYDFVTKTDIAHPLAGYVTGDILPYSIWDLLHRSNSENEGMVFDPDTKLWWDIYLESWSGSLPQSKYGAVHMTGASTYPAHGEKFAELASLVHKRLPDRDDFICVAKGSNENTNITGSTDQSTVGGHVDTSNRRMISNIGLEECCGYLWQWVRTSNANGSSNWQSTTYASAVDGAKSYGSSYGAFYRALVGGSWSDGSYCGSRCVDVYYVSAAVLGNFGGRFCAKERVINFI